MPAGRDTDWTHVRVVGDKNKAAPYVSFGRKLLGFVKEDAAHNGLQTHKVTKRLSDGALVVAEIHGKQLIITIVPPSSIALGVKRMEDRFVTFAKREGLWGGIDADHPEQWLDAPGVTRESEDGWLTRYFDSEIAGYADDDGIYSVMEGVSAFPQGTRRAGNIDHRSKDGYRVSWYGPSSRVALDACIDDGAVWLNKVFMHGDVLLTVPDGLVVLGAGLYGGSLFTVEAPWPGPGDYTTTEPDWDSAAYPPALVTFYAPGAQLQVCRYPAGARTIPGRRAKIGVNAEAREVLLALDWQGREAYPWTFNPDCTEASGMSTNDNGPGSGSPLYGLGFYYTGMRTSNMFDPGTPPTGFRFADEDGTLTYAGTEGWFPYPADTRYTITIERDEGGQYTASGLQAPASLPSGDAGIAVVARDYDEDGSRVDLMIERATIPAGAAPFDQPGALFLRLDDLRLPIREATGPHATKPYPPETVSRPVPTTSRFLLHADLPQRTLVIGVVKSVFEWRDAPHFSYVETRENRIEVWRRGEQLADVLVSTTDATLDDAIGYPLICDRLLSPFDYKTAFDAMLAVPLAPSFALYGYAFAFDRVWGSTDLDPGVSPIGNFIWGALGASPSFMYSAYPADYNFGWMQVAGGTPYKTIDYTDLIAPDVTLDLRYVPFWGATLGDHTLLSGPSFDNAAPLAAFTWADDAGDTDRSLPDLTGVGGTHQRYHPLWRLGRFDLVLGDSP